MGKKIRDLGLFIKWVFVGGLLEANIENFKKLTKWIKKPINQSYVLLGLALYFTLIKKFQLAVVLLIFAALFNLRSSYISGKWKQWNRQKKGILSPKQRLRQEFKLEQEVKDGTGINGNQDARKD